MCESYLPPPLSFPSPPRPKILGHVRFLGVGGAQAKSFKRPKNREDGSDLDNFLAKSSASIRSRFRKKLRAVLALVVVVVVVVVAVVVAVVVVAVD